MSIGIKLAIIIIGSLLVNILLAAAVGKSCKMRGIKGKGKWVTLVLFFPIIAGFIYIIKMDKKTTVAVPKKSSTRTAIIILLVLAVVSYAACSAVSKSIDTKDIEYYMSEVAEKITGVDLPIGDFVHYGFSDDDELYQYFYDMNGKKCIDNYEVLYYTADNEKYVFEYSYEEGAGLTNCNTEKFYRSQICFVDEKGYLIIDDTLYDAGHTMYEPFEKDGKLYYLASEVSWDAQGNMMFNSGTYINK